MIILTVPWARFAHLHMQTFSWENLKNTYPYLKIFSTLYCWFIDGIFFLWNGTETELIKFIDNLNQKHPLIKFEFTYSRTSIPFLNMKKERFVLLSIENQVIAIISCTINRRTRKHWKTAYHTVKLCG